VVDVVDVVTAIIRVFPFVNDEKVASSCKYNIQRAGLRGEMVGGDIEV